jgi:PAS domain S-box-containing protein
MASFRTLRVGRTPVAIRYALAVLAALAALLLRQMLSLWLGANYPYLTVSAAVVFSGWYCGVGPSVVTTLTTLLGVWYWFDPIAGSFALVNPKAQVAGMVVFLFLSGFIIALGETNRRSRTRLERSEFRLRRLIESNIIPMVCTNMERISEANDVFLNMVGYSRDDLDKGAMDWMKMTPPEYVSKDTHALEQIEKLGFCTPFEKEYIRRDGSRVPILIGSTVLSTSPLETLCFVVDLSDLKRVEAELRKAHHELEHKVEERTQELAESVATLESEMLVRKETEEQLRELSARLLRLQDEERHRVARDLHDSTGQTLAALKLTLASLATLVGSVPKAPDLLNDLNALADQALQEIRTTSHLLHPPLLDEVGFSSAAQWYVDGFSNRSGIKASLELSAPPRLTKAAELVLFRVLQESLTNVLRHSGSEAVDIRLHCDDENAFLTIGDYGRGIPAAKLKSFHETGAGVGVGLGGMKHRVGELGGQLRVECDGKGTRVTATVPLAKTEESSRDHDSWGRSSSTSRLTTTEPSATADEKSSLHQESRSMVNSLFSR